ncbi:glycoside hydrolase [Chaetomidium leptoderma]|uniref:Endo-chitosanase n=1 Tax=Chaetomidium leptoderma TaxID=669021 RepID=A0AAN6ZWM1_9PEZI|nr:glycoside hydrolase [Chaetomidium leptoderma]
MHNRVLLSALVGAASVSARDTPAHVQSFYDALKAKGACSNKLATGFYAKDEGPNTFAYCGDHLVDNNVIYIKGAGSSLADMDIDCDGEQNGRGDDGRCKSSSDTQSITSFQHTIKGYKKGINDLNSYVHPYVVFGNEGFKKGWKTFDPREYGVEPLSIIAVVCPNKQTFFGIWGDTNGDDGDKPMVGEASISMATACFGTSMNGNNGHDENDVLYLAFPGPDAVPGANGAQWGATSWQAFEASIETLGNKLLERIIGSSSGGGGGGGTDPTKPPPDECSWAGHCEGAKCTGDDLCSGTLHCDAGEKVCTTEDCSWAGHCLGAKCASHADCADPYECNAGAGYCWHVAA